MLIWVMGKPRPVAPPLFVTTLLLAYHPFCYIRELCFEQDEACGQGGQARICKILPRRFESDRRLSTPPLSSPRLSIVFSYAQKLLTPLFVTTLLPSCDHTHNSDMLIWVKSGDDTFTG